VGPNRTAGRRLIIQDDAPDAFSLDDVATDATTTTVAGSTDILISYAYKLAIATGRGQDFALASAVAIVIFLIVGTISITLFWRSKSLENLA